MIDYKKLFYIESIFKIYIVSEGVTEFVVIELDTIDDLQTIASLQEYAGTMNCKLSPVCLEGYSSQYIITNTEKNIDEVNLDIQQNRQIYAEITFNKILRNKIKYFFTKPQDPISRMFKTFYRILPFQSNVTLIITLDNYGTLDTLKNNMKNLFKTHQSHCFPECTVFIDIESWNPYLV